MNLYLLCVIVFFVRIIDTALATIRTILVIRNKIIISAVIAFFEILIWFLVVKEAITTTQNSILIAISYAGGFAIGIFLGILITDKVITSVLSVNVVINNNKKKLFKSLTDKNFAFSVSKVKGKDLVKSKNMLFIVTTNKRIKELKKIVNHYDKSAFIVISDNKHIYNGYY